MKGSDNIVTNLDRPNPDLKQLKALLGTEIARLLGSPQLTVQKAVTLTRVPATDLSRIRCADLNAFTVDHLMTILGRLGYYAEVTIEVRPLPTIADLVA